MDLRQLPHHQLNAYDWKKMRYEIDESFAVRIFNDGEDVPFWFQPDYPNEETFDSMEEAETWAKLAIASFDEMHPFAPNGKGMAGEPKPTKDELAQIISTLKQ